MKLIVGLGNPGEKYARNRHNIGFMFVDAFISFLENEQSAEVKSEFKFDSVSAKFTLNDTQLLLTKPQTFMNNSGQAVVGLMQFYKIEPEDVYIVHDDLDIPVGKYKIEKGHGPRQHNGINSIEERIGNKEFWRVRMGVENRGENRLPGEAYVLQNFTDEERKAVESIFPEIFKKIL